MSHADIQEYRKRATAAILNADFGIGGMPYPSDKDAWVAKICRIGDSRIRDAISGHQLQFAYTRDYIDRMLVYIDGSTDAWVSFFARE